MSLVTASEAVVAMHPDEVRIVVYLQFSCLCMCGRYLDSVELDCKGSGRYLSLRWCRWHSFCISNEIQNLMDHNHNARQSRVMSCQSTEGHAGLRYVNFHPCSLTDVMTQTDKVHTDTIGQHLKHSEQLKIAIHDMKIFEGWWWAAILDYSVHHQGLEKVWPLVMRGDL